MARAGKRAADTPDPPSGPPRMAGSAQCGHVVTGRPDLCPCRDVVDQESGSIDGTEDEIRARAVRLGVNPDAYWDGWRAAARAANQTTR